MHLELLRSKVIQRYAKLRDRSMNSSNQQALQEKMLKKKSTPKLKESRVALQFSKS